MKSIQLLLLVVVFAGCGKKKEEVPAGGGVQPTPTVVADAADTGSAPGSAAAGSAAQPVDVPTEEDFEDQAANDITEKNVEAKVKQLETELGQ